MSDTQSSNSQTATTPPATPAGPSSEELQARIAELEKSREGILRDVQEERRKRQELESKLNQPAPAPSAAQNDVTQDELGRVLKPYIDPVKKEAEAARAMLQKYEEEKALEVVAARLGKSKQDVLADKVFQDRFTSTINKYGVRGASLSDLATKAMELMDLEDLRAKEAERVRVAKANDNSSLPSGTPSAPNPSKRELTQEEWDKLSLTDYEKLSQNGSFVQDPNTGKIVYTPN